VNVIHKFTDSDQVHWHKPAMNSRGRSVQESPAHITAFLVNTNTVYFCF